ncbi:beta-1,6-N-acetylglucosaminyltransferase [Sporomusa malonica]|uniref:Peptide O-xylosyltransferase n=1 Tax=Sporomusa malonica TaxID=112901 RepID=A0A1W2DLQ5_9FIRM|nr:beta-1,6-N-acetylglucosaminyltransferase [Sporomusa malonica]SMC97992.1 Core-2/I-Branching enzyme [Sporomusa malonica]
MYEQKKHAYLIMAYNNFYVLEKLLLLLDDNRNDIYVHVDKKTSDFDKNYFDKLNIYSNIFFIERRNVYWADYSQVDVTLALLRAATKNKQYHYYHLLSGSDLPIKSQDYIHDFFRNKDCQFVGIVPRIFWYSIRRVKYYFPFLDNRYYRNSKILKAFVAVLVLIQQFCQINRLKYYELDIYNGWTWFSISHSFASYLIEQENTIAKMFQKAMAPDELFIQTMAFNSDYKDKIFDITDLKNGSMRYIDWKRGTPYVFRSSDFEDLINSRYLFARKFDENVDRDIIDRVYHQVKK